MASPPPLSLGSAGPSTGDIAAAAAGGSLPTTTTTAYQRRSSAAHLTGSPAAHGSSGLVAALETLLSDTATFASETARDGLSALRDWAAAAQQARQQQPSPVSSRRGSGTGSNLGGFSPRARSPSSSAVQSPAAAPEAGLIAPTTPPRRDGAGAALSGPASPPPPPLAAPTARDVVAQVAAAGPVAHAEFTTALLNLLIQQQQQQQQNLPRRSQSQRQQHLHPNPPGALQPLPPPHHHHHHHSFRESYWLARSTTAAAAAQPQQPVQPDDVECALTRLHSSVVQHHTSASFPPGNHHQQQHQQSATVVASSPPPAATARPPLDGSDSGGAASPDLAVQQPTFVHDAGAEGNPLAWHSANAESTQSMLLQSAVATSHANFAEDTAGFGTLNQYLVLQELGRGAQGRVFLALDTTCNSMRAVKEVSRPQSTNYSVRARLRTARERAALMREVAIMKRLRHRHIVSLYEVIDDPSHDRLYMVMQYVDRGAIAKAVDYHWTCVDPVKLLDYARQLAAGLVYLHNKGIAHRDIKPDNLLRDEQGNAFLADFGVSALVRSGNARGDRDSGEDDDPAAASPRGRSPSGPELRQPSAVLVGGTECLNMSSAAGIEPAAPTHKGTLAFSAPELIAPEAFESSGAASVDEDSFRADVWALGMSLFAMLFGRLPYDPRDMTAFLDAIVADDVRLPRHEAEDDVVTLAGGGGDVNVAASSGAGAHASRSFRAFHSPCAAVNGNAASSTMDTPDSMPFAAVTGAGPESGSPTAQDNSSATTSGDHQQQQLAGKPPLVIRRVSSAPQTGSLSGSDASSKQESKPAHVPRAEESTSVGGAAVPPVIVTDVASPLSVQNNSSAHGLSAFPSPNAAGSASACDRAIARALTAAGVGSSSLRDSNTLHLLSPGSVASTVAPSNDRLVPSVAAVALKRIKLLLAMTLRRDPRERCTASNLHAQVKRFHREVERYAEELADRNESGGGDAAGALDVFARSRMASVAPPPGSDESNAITTIVQRH